MSALLAHKRNLLDFNTSQMCDFFEKLGEKPFRAQQVMQWIHQFGKTDFAEMTNLSKALRIKLAEATEVRLPEIVSDQASQDGTHKWLLKLSCGN